MMDNRDIAVFVGAFGSGKTETAINYVLKSAQSNPEKKHALVDLDIVNPYFRSREEEQYLTERNIRVICTSLDSRQADLPALSPEIFSVFQDTSYNAVFDVGGDPNGARVLGRYHQYFEAEPAYQMYLVVNPYRPMTGTPQGIVDMANSIVPRSRIRLTGIVCNAHMKAETDLPIIKRGYEIVKQSADALQLPISFICVPEWLQVSQEEFAEPLFPLQLFMMPFWEKGQPGK
ncbi:MAG TPA: ATP-binding protein [Firmicutes bacterium]|nr:ATP-binding protein [Bacillota bacterium]HAW70893.1 ATP-binding protein [Bacillota bacterium]HAZ21669.1 ATP-binding protein [Bacillota bacterium]HBL48638.1 ATP-binding protein [Bacillota bacterium]HBL67672.1 ATP-binding protein [Bacillota bacterium]